MNRVLLEYPMQLKLKNNDTDRHLGRYKIVMTSKSLLDILIKNYRSMNNTYFLGSFGEPYTKLLRNFTNLLKVYKTHKQGG